MKTIQIDQFTGVRNDVTPERMKPGDLTRGVNIELDETGKPQRRLGITTLDGTATHSLWANEDVCLCVRGGVLHRVTDSLTFQSLGVTIRDRVSYVKINNDVFFTDNYITGMYGRSGYAVWGKTKVNANNVTFSPPPAGKLLGVFNGRIYIGVDNYLWYTEAYDYHHVNLMANFLGFTAPVTTFASVSDGIFVGTTEETLFLKGSDPSNFELEKVAPYGTVLGTETEVPALYVGGDQKPNQPVPAWMSKKGLCIGLDGGQLMNLTGERYLLPEGVATGASLFKLRGGSPQLVSTLFS